MKYRISIPATSANLGPGFDSLGLALGLHNIYEVEVHSHAQVTFDLSKTGCEFNHDENFIATAMAYTQKKFNLPETGCHIELIHCDIPVSRGLGSSAAAIIAGVAIAGLICQKPLSLDAIVETATEIEGHPDNVVPACLGHLTVSIAKDNAVFHSQIVMPDDLGIAIMIPNFKLSTQEARSVLPTSFSRSECIYNISRASMLIAAITNRDYHLLQHATDDCIHQPYRMALIPKGFELLESARQLGSLGSFISGAGPTLLTLYNRNEPDFINALSEVIGNTDNVWRLVEARSDQVGLNIQQLQ